MISWLHDFRSGCPRRVHGRCTAEPRPTTALYPWALLLVACALMGCAAPNTQTGLIDLNRLEPLSVAASTPVKPLRVAVAAIVSPRGTLDTYTPLLEQLSHRLNRPVELVQRRTYTEVNDLLEAGGVDLAFVCTSAYVVGEREFGMQLLAAPQVKGELVYYSVLIVPADSTADDMADLRGAVFAFTDPISTSGRNYPVALVQQLGATPAEFFRRTFHTYSHDDAIRAVADHVADGAAVDSLVYAFALEREPQLAQQTRVIHQSPPFGIPPVVIAPTMPPQQAADLRTILLTMHDDPAGLAALRTAGIDRFVLVDDALYDSVRILEAGVNSAP